MTSNLLSQVLRCPDCSSSFLYQDDYIFCSNCDYSAPLVAGIPSLTQDLSKSFPNNERIDPICGDSSHNGCHREAGALEEDITSAARRAAWRLLLPCGLRKRVLHFGCGGDTTFMGLAGAFPGIIAADLDYPVLKHLSARIRQPVKGEIVFLHTGDILPLPFGDEVFDLIVLSGVFASLPSKFPGHNPWEVQARYLKELARILTPDGCIVIAANNRASYENFLGKRGRHLKWHHIVFPQKALLRLCSHVHHGHDFPNYAYSPKGYRQLFGSAGFAARVYSAFPQYREFSQLVSLDGEQQLTLDSSKTWVRSSLKKWFFASKRFRNFLPSLIVIGSRSAAVAETELDRIYKTAGKVDPRLSDIQPINLFVNGTTRQTAFSTASKKGHKYLFRLPLNAQSIRACERNRDNLRSLAHCLSNSPHMTNYIPSFLTEGTVGQQRYYVETCLDGSGITPFTYLRPTALKSLVEEALTFLAQLHLTTKNDWNETISCAHTIDAIYGRADLSKESSSTDATIRQSRDLIAQALTNARLRPVFTHGDYKLANLLYQRRSVCGVVDWEGASPKGLPYLDCLNILFDGWMRLNSVPDTDVQRAVFEFLKISTLDPWLLAAEASYKRKVDIPEQCRQALSILFYVYKIGDRREFCGQSPRLEDARKHISCLIES